MSISWARRALKELARFDEATQERVIKAVIELAENRRGMREELYRLRVGEWRVIFSYGSARSIQVHRIRARGGAYRP